MKADAARVMAVEAAVRVEAGERSQEALADLIRSGPPHPGRGRATDTFYNLIRWQGRVDYLLEPHCQRPLHALDPEIRHALRLGAMEFAVFGRPGYAVVSEAVQVTKALRPTGSGFVNAVLRRLVASPLRPLPDDPVAAAAVEHSHPRWLVQRWMSRLGGARAKAWMEADNARPDLALRVNLTKGTASAYLRAFGVEGRLPGLDVPTAVVVAPQPVRSLPGFQEGWVSVQGLASQAVTLRVPVAAGARVADVCAGRGTKSLFLMERQPALCLVALDVDGARLAAVEGEARRLGVPAPEVRRQDARHPDPDLCGTCDAVLVDAPCSGLGTLRRHPEIRWRRAPSDLARNHDLQLAILKGAKLLLRPGGTLVYAVCSTEPEETTEVKADFLKDAADLSPGAGERQYEPDLEGTEGFFVTTFIKRGGAMPAEGR